MWSIATIQVTIVLVCQFVYPLLPGCYQRNITYINGLTQEGVSMYQIDKALLAIYVDLYDDICGFIGYNYTYIVI